MADKRFILIVSIAFAIILVLVCVGMALLPDNEDSVPLSDEQVSNDLSGNSTGDSFRVLVAGKDRASGLYDVMMLVSFDRTAKTACVLQIPRDTYFEYTERSYKKINGAPAALGMRGFCDLLGEALGVSVDSYISLDLDAFAKAVDAIGGVEIDLPEPLDYSDPAQDLRIHLPAGRQTLDGKAAEQFVRFRSGYLRGDLGRLDAQKLFMASFFEKCTSSLSISEAEGLTAALLPSVKTDMGIFQLVGLATDALAVKKEDIVFVTAPGEDAVSEVSGAWYYLLSARSMEGLLEEYFGECSDFDKKRLFLNEKNPSSVKIYESNIPPDIFSAGDVVNNGIDIK